MEECIRLVTKVQINMHGRLLLTKPVRDLLGIPETEGAINLVITEDGKAYLKRISTLRNYRNEMQRIVTLLSKKLRKDVVLCDWEGIILASEDFVIKRRDLSQQSSLKMNICEDFLYEEGGSCLLPLQHYKDFALSLNCIVKDGVSFGCLLVLDDDTNVPLTDDQLKIIEYTTDILRKFID